MHGEHAGEKLITKAVQPAMLALAVDPDNPKMLYAAFEDNQLGSFQISIDSEKTWAASAPLLAGTHRLLVDPTPGAKDRKICAIGKSSVVARVYGQWLKVPLPAGVSELSSVAAGFSSNRPATLYLVAGRALLISSDSGNSWRKSSLPGNPEVRAIAARPDHPEIAHVSYRGLKYSSESGATRYLGVARPEDGGATWTLVRKESVSDHKAFGDNWIGEYFGSDYALGFSEARMGARAGCRPPPACLTPDSTQRTG